MATGLATGSSSNNSCNLCIDNFNQVALACRDVSHEWEELAKHLNINRVTVLSIQKEKRGGSTTECLDKLLTTWLRQPSPDQPKPSWRILCDAVSRIDRPLSEKIWTHHTRECSLCYGNKQPSHITSNQGSTSNRSSDEDIAVNYHEVFKGYYNDLVTAMVTSCSLMKVTRDLKSVDLISQSAFDFVNPTRISSEPDQCVIRLLRELTTFLQISKNTLKKRKAMTDFCRVLRDQDSPVLSEMASRLSDELEHPSHVTSDHGNDFHRASDEVSDTAVNHCDVVFKNHYSTLVTAMVTSCSLSNVARDLKSVNLVSQGAVDYVNANRLSEPDQCVTRLLREIITFLKISKNASKKCQAMIDFCRVLRDQDSPVLTEMVSQLSDELGI